MKQRYIYIDKEIKRLKSYIRKVYPHVNKVDIKIDRLPSGDFKSLIRVIATQKKELVAQKKAEDIKKSLEKSRLAIVRQLHKTKNKWKRKSNKFFDYPLSA